MISLLEEEYAIREIFRVDEKERTYSFLSITENAWNNLLSLVFHLKEQFIAFFHIKSHSPCCRIDPADYLDPRMPPQLPAASP